MRLKNVFKSSKFLEKSHDGNGMLIKVRPFESSDFKTPIDFIDYVIVEPDSTIGYHTHGENEEIYFISKGNGIMKTNSETFEITEGDIIINSFGDSHGLINNSEHNMEILIFQASIQ